MSARSSRWGEKFLSPLVPRACFIRSPLSRVLATFDYQNNLCLSAQHLLSQMRFFVYSSRISCGAFHKKYPQIKVNLDIGNVGSSDVLWNKLKNGEVDLLVTYATDHSKYITEPIFKERLVIAMHKEMKGAKELAHMALTHEELLAGAHKKEREIEDLSVFNNIEFIKYSNKSDTARRMTRMLGDFKTASCEIKNARHSEMHYNLMCAGIGAVITTDSAVIQKQHNAKDILFFLPKSKESHRTIYIARQHSTDDNPIVKNFIQTAKAYSSLK